MKKEDYLNLKQKLILAGYGHEIEWAENLKPCDNADDFFCEYMWVVLNAGMKNQVARLIQQKIYKAWDDGQGTHSVFGHTGKADAIDHTSLNREHYFRRYLKATDKIEFLKILPWIGDITKYHLAKNLGHDCCKPDRHISRCA
jgi:hypothetical protein